MVQRRPLRHKNVFVVGNKRELEVTEAKTFVVVKVSKKCTVRDFSDNDNVSG